MNEGAAAKFESGSASDVQFDEAFLRKLEQLAVIAQRVAARAARGERPTRRAPVPIVRFRAAEPSSGIRARSNRCCAMMLLPSGVYPTTP